MKTHPFLLFGIGVFFLLVFVPTNGLAAKPILKYHLAATVPIAGDGGWDFVAIDAPKRRAYIAHNSQVDVVNIKTNTVYGMIRNTEGVHGIAFADEYNRGFITNGRSNSVLMFDLNTLDTLGRVSVGEKPDAIIYEPYTRTIIVMNAKGESISVLDARSGRVIHTIPIGGGPECAVSDAKGFIYVNLEDASENLQISTKTWRVVRQSSLAPGEGPTGLAIDPKTGRLFAGCANKLLIVLDASTGHVVAKLSAGSGIDGCVFDTKTKLAIVPNGKDATMTIYCETSPSLFQLQQTVPTALGARTIALDPTTDDIFLVTADFGSTPEKTNANPHPRPSILPQTFRLLRYSMK